MVFGKDQKMQGKNNPFYGKTHSEESKKLMRESQKKINHSGRFKKGHKISKESKRKQAETRSRLYSGENSPRWDGGKKRYWQKKARDLMIKRGFDLTGLHVHHKNHDIKDNRLVNLKLLTPKDHGKIHGKDTKNIPPRKFWFKKGNKPWNKGIKVDYIKRDKKGRFIKK